MSNTQPPVNSIAPLTNVTLAVEAMEQAINRGQGLPGMVCLYGPSGYGKSKAAAFVANKYRCYYIEAKSIWQRKTYLINILKDMGVVPERTMDLMLDQICEQLTLSQRPLIIDEADYLVDKGWAKLLMDIYEGSRAPIMIIGEENISANLKKKNGEKVHNRIIDWQPAQPASMADGQLLTRIYSPDVVIADDLLEHIINTVNGCTRRVAVNINKVRKTAKAEGRESAELAWWGGRELFTGEAPARRR